MGSLDRIQSLTGLVALEAEPAAFSAELDLPVDLEARDAVFAHALGDIDDAAARFMRICMDHALADDRSIAPPTRKVFATTVISYADRLAMLAERVRDIAARSTPDPEPAVAAVVSAAHRTLALRDALREPVLARIRDSASTAIADADRRARDRNLDDLERKRWSAVRRELEAIAEQPDRVLAAPFAARIAGWPEQIDASAPEREPTRFELIELD